MDSLSLSKTQATPDRGRELIFQMIVTGNIDEDAPLSAAHRRAVAAYAKFRARELRAGRKAQARPAVQAPAPRPRQRSARSRRSKSARTSSSGSGSSDGPSDSPYLKIDEAAAFARAEIATVRYWIALKKLRSFKPGRRVLIRRDDLIAFIEGAPPSDELTTAKKPKRVIGPDGALPGQMALFAANAGKRSGRSPRSAQSGEVTNHSTHEHASEPPDGRHSERSERSGLAGVQGRAATRQDAVIEPHADGSKTELAIEPSSHPSKQSDEGQS